MAVVDDLNLAEEKKRVTDEGMVATNATTGAAEARPLQAKQEVQGSEAGEILNLHNKQVKNSSKDEKAMRSGSKALSSFLALPVELHLHIILDLAQSIDPGLLSLREVNRYFRSIVTPTDLHIWGTTLLENKQFQAADRLYGFLGVEDRLPCTLCQCLLPKKQFHMQSKQGKKALGHKLGYKRFCMDCGIKYRKFGGGNSVKVDDQTEHYKVVCSECLEFLDGPEGIPNCFKHLLLSDNEKRRLKLLRLRGSGQGD